MRQVKRFLGKTLKYTVYGVGICGAGVGGYALYDSGFRRQMQFYRRAGPILMHYKYVEYTYDPKKIESKYQQLHEKYAQQILDIILDLRGLYVKAGQFMTGRPDVTPRQWIDKLRVLQVLFVKYYCMYMYSFCCFVLLCVFLVFLLFFFFFLRHFAIV